MTFERSNDWKLIKAIVTHPKIYEHISDDCSPDQDDWQPIQHEHFWYVLVKDIEEALGLWAFHPINGICYEVHTCLLPSSWGTRAHEAVRELVPWVWKNMPCRRVVTQVPKYNRMALHFAKHAGLREFGTNEKSFLKHGKLHDVVWLGISKPEAA